MLGEELIRAREAAGMTQEGLAHKAGIDRTYVSQLENNHKSPTVDMLFRICDALDVSASAILAKVEKTRHRR